MTTLAVFAQPVPMESTSNRSDSNRLCAKLHRMLQQDHPSKDKR